MKLSNIKNILYIGDMWDGSWSSFRFLALKDMGYKVNCINSNVDFKKNYFKKKLYQIFNKFSYSLDLNFVNNQIYKKTLSQQFDILWIDKGLVIDPTLLRDIKKKKRVKFIIGYSGDDMHQKHSQSIQWKQGLNLYDLYLTTKTYNVSELTSMGATNVMFVNNTYYPKFHKPRRVNIIEKKKLGSHIGFIGAWEKERMDSMLFITKNDILVRWWGGGWSNKNWKSNEKKLIYENEGLWGHNYVKAINSIDINLCFLRKINRDLQTSRSVEIPACGGFMLAERTSEHLQLFEEEKEAAFFSSNEELLEKIKFYSINSNFRTKVALAGRKRCEKSGYSVYDILSQIFSRIKI